MNASSIAVITGASRGIGEEYARSLAAQGYNLLLVARDEPRLHSLKQELEKTSHVQIWVESLDLARPSAAHDLYRRATNLEQPISLVINNAGFGWYGEFTNMPQQTIQDMLRVHIDMTTICTRLFLEDMKIRGQGTIINVASIAGLFPIPYMGLYAATKAYIISFSEAVAEEVKERGIHIQVCCPGYTKTDFHETAGHRPRHVFSAQSVEEVVTQSLHALQTSKVRVTIGWSGRIARWITHWVPRGPFVSLISKFVKKGLT